MTTKSDRQTSRRQYIAEWVAQYGSESQRERLELDLLPEDEVLQEIRRQALSSIEAGEYVDVTAGDIDHDEGCSAREDVVCIVDEDKVPVSEALWPSYRRIREQAPEGANLVVRRHVCSCPECQGVLDRYGVRVHVELAPGVTAYREYLLEEAPEQLTYPERSE